MRIWTWGILILAAWVFFPLELDLKARLFRSRRLRRFSFFKGANKYMYK